MFMLLLSYIIIFYLYNNEFINYEIEYIPTIIMNCIFYVIFYKHEHHLIMIYIVGGFHPSIIIIIHSFIPLLSLLISLSLSFLLFHCVNYLFIFQCAYDRTLNSCFYYNCNQNVKCIFNVSSFYILYNMVTEMQAAGLQFQFPGALHYNIYCTLSCHILEIQLM